MKKPRRATRSSYALAVNRALKSATGKRRHGIHTRLGDAELKGFENYRTSRGLTRAQALRVLVVLGYTFHAKPPHVAGAQEQGQTYEAMG